MRDLSLKEGTVNKEMNAIPLTNSYLLLLIKENYFLKLNGNMCTCKLNCKSGFSHRPVTGQPRSREELNEAAGVFF